MIKVTLQVVDAESVADLVTEMAACQNLLGLEGETDLVLPSSGTVVREYDSAGALTEALADILASDDEAS